MEAALAGIWAEVLNLPRIGRHDSFFELGGHSLLATRVVSRIERTLGVKLSLRDLFEHVTVAKLAEWLNQEPPTRVAALPFESREPGIMIPPVGATVADEPQPQPTAWSETASDDPPGLCIHELFEAQARRTPEAVAVVFEDQSLTYGELNRLADRLAHELTANGVGPEVLVGAFLERSMEFAVALMAVLKAGGAIVPIAPDLPPERLAFIISDSQTPVVLTHSSIRGQLPLTESTVICVDQLPVADFSGAPVVKTFPRNLAWVIYTSGSTGRPKGVMLTHSAYLNYYAAAIRYLGLEPTDRCLQFGSFSFDVGIDQLLTPLLAGATIVMCGTEIWHPAVFSDHVRELRLSVIHLPAAYWNEWVEELQRSAVREAIGALRLVEVGGDVMPVAAVRGWVGLRLNSVRLVNRYGPTETVMFCTAYEVPSELSAVASLERIPIGKPVGPRTIHLLDSLRNPVAAGEVGEIFIGGATLARGYFNRPELTAERILADPFSAIPEARLYQTGDLARMLPDGNLDFLGRADFQVKLRGFRIELGEIDEVMRRHPTVREAVTVLRSNQPENRYLVVFLAAKANAVIKPQELRLHAMANLPNYMVPAQFVSLERLPLTPNGKADRRALQQLEGPELSSAAERIRPRNRVEAQLAAIWQETLGIAEIGMRDNFFELGGHSLLAMRLIARISHKLKVKVTVRQLIEAQTIEALASQLGQAGLELQAPLQPVSRESPPRLSFAQERLWFLHQYAPESATYHMESAFRLRGRLDIPVLESSLGLIISRHDSLRTVFGLHDNEPIQTTIPYDSFRLEVSDGHALAVVGEAALRHQLAADAAVPFDLAREMPCRFKLYRLEDGEHVFLMVFNHVIFDGWSMGIFCRELTTSYAAFAAGTRPELPELPIQYVDYARWERHWLQGETSQRLIGYWRDKLAHAPAHLNLPTDFPRPAVASHRGGVVEVHLDAGLSGSLSQLAKQENATLFMVLLAAFKIVLFRYSGEEDIVVGSPIANRQRKEVEELVGIFINTLALRTSLSGNPTFREVLHRVRETAVEAYEHGTVPYEAVLQAIKPERDASLAAVFQVMFNYLDFGQDDFRLSGLEAAPFSDLVVAAKFDIEIYVSLKMGNVGLRLVYRAELFTPATMARLLEHYQTLLAALVAQPDWRLSQLRLSSEAEIGQLPDPRQPLEVKWPVSVVVRFLEWVGSHPNRIAVCDSEGAWTYAELEANSRRIAAKLSDSGLGRGELVAVLARRGRWLAAALLGVWRAGGAFVVLDLSLPPAVVLERFQMARPKRWLSMAGPDVLPAELITYFASVPELDGFLVTQVSEATRGFREAPPTPDDLAYLAFTSGSNGRPKGVFGTHGPINHFLAWHTERFQMTAQDRFSGMSGLGHDPLLRDLLAPLWVGGVVCLPATDFVAQGHVSSWMADQAITVSHLTPAMLELLIAAAKPLPTLRFAFVVGEPLRANLVRHFRVLAPHTQVVNFYGTTETPQAVAFEVLAAETPTDHREGSAPIGRGIHGVQLLVLGSHHEQLGVGMVGEIGVRTPCLTLGYLADPALTATRFVTNPATNNPSDRIYLTGDLGWYLPDGRVQLAGRRDDQVKVRGFRIELGEVESALRRCASVREAVVLMQEANGNRHLVAYVVMETRMPDASPSLRAQLRGLVPQYMIPARFCVLSQLPVMANGKVDRAALAAMNGDAAALAPADNVPRTDIECRLAAIWQDVLGVPQVGVHDNFFELGGHSLLAMRLLSEIQNSFGIGVLLAALFSAPTIAEFEAWLLSERNGDAARQPTQGLRGKGNGIPLFHVPGLGGFEFLPEAIARRVGETVRFFDGLQYPGLNGRDAVPRTVADLAASLIPQIQRVSPHGPYCLSGYSFGGVVALEVARQLKASDVEVSLVLLLDSRNPASRLRKRSLAEIVRMVLRLFTAKGSQGGGAFLIRLVMKKIRFLAMNRQTTPIPPGSREGDSTVEPPSQIIRQSQRAYRPLPFDGKVVLFRVEAWEMCSGLRFAPDALYGWGEVVPGGVEVIQVPGDHGSLVKEPAVVTLADRIHACLEKVNRTRSES
jgi:amino acid adenylation domain-containing protein